MKKIINLLVILLFVLTFILVAFSKISILYIFPIYIIYSLILFVIFRNEFDAIVANYNYAIGNGDKAENLFIKSIKNNTKNPITYLNYAIMLSHKGEGAEAIKILEKAEKLQPKILTKKNILLTKATCYWVAKDVDKGIEQIHELINKYDYANPNALTTLGYFYIEKGDYDNALKYTKKALSDDPNYFLAYDNLGQINFRLGEIDEAIKNFEKVTENYNYPDSLYYLGLIYLERKDFDKARICLEKANNCNITALNTITKEMVQEKITMSLS